MQGSSTRKQELLLLLQTTHKRVLAVLDGVVVLKCRITWQRNGNTSVERASVFGVFAAHALGSCQGPAELKPGLTSCVVAGVGETMQRQDCSIDLCRNIKESAREESGVRVSNKK